MADAMHNRDGQKNGERKMTKTIIIGGIVAAMTIALAISWIFASAFMSFALWDWSAAHSSIPGRIVWTWFFLIGTIGGNGMTSIYRKAK